MAYDEALAQRIEQSLAGTKGITSKKMFGGLAFLHHGNMLCGVDNKHNLMLRVGPEQYDKALKHKYAREMDFTGRPLKGMIYIEPAGFKNQTSLDKWINMGLAFTTSLPKK